MQKRFFSSPLAIVLVIAVLFGLGWAGQRAWEEAVWPLNQRSETALQRRAQLFWDLKTSGKVEEAYGYMAESYRRRVTPGAFARTGGGLVIHTGATVENVEIDGEKGQVSLELRHFFNKPAFRNLEQRSKIRDTWVFENGAWYRWPQERPRR